MARRASSGLNPGIIIGGVVLVALLIYGGKTLLQSDSSAFEGVPKLRVEDFLENGNSLRDSEYVIEGEVDEKLQFSERGQLVSVRVKGGSGDQYIPVVIPSKLIDSNIEVQQSYAFRIKFKKGGIAVATGINRL